MNYFAVASIKSGARFICSDGDLQAKKYCEQRKNQEKTGERGTSLPSFVSVLLPALNIFHSCTTECHLKAKNKLLQALNNVLSIR